VQLSPNQILLEINWEELLSAREPLCRGYISPIGFLFSIYFLFSNASSYLINIQPRQFWGVGFSRQAISAEQLNVNRQGELLSTQQHYWQTLNTIEARGKLVDSQ